MKKLLGLLMLISVLALAVGVTQAADPLRVWIMETGNEEAAKEFVAAVNEDFAKLHPNVEVEVSFIPWPSAQQKFITSITGGIAPDVAEMGTTWNPQFAAMGALEDLTGFTNSLSYSDSFIPALVESATYKDKLYGIPWYAGNRAILYRKDWLKEAGYDELPTTWEGWVEVAKAMTKDTDGDGKIDRYGFAANGNSYHEFLPMVWMAGGEIAVETEDGWRSGMNSEEAKTALDTWLELYNEASPEASVTWNALNSRKAFTNGLVGMVIDVSPIVPRFLSENPDLAGKIGIAPIPYKEKPASFTGGSNLVIFKQSDKKELAKDYVKVLMSPEHQLAWAKMIKFYPGRMDVFAAAGFYEDPVMSVYAGQLKYGRTYPPTPAWGQIEGARTVLDNLQAIMMGNLEPEAGLDKMAKEMDAIFKKLK